MAADWKKGALAGIVAGIVFVALEMIAVGVIMGGSPWGPPRMMAAIVLGKGALPPPATFDAGIVFVGMVVHFALSAIFGVIFAFAANRMCKGTLHATIAGAIFGLAIYVVDFYGLTTVFPWFEMARTPVTVTTHIIFGGVLGWLYWGWRTEALTAG